MWVNNASPISVGSAYEKFGLTLLQFHGIITAMPRKWKEQLKKKWKVDNVHATNYDILVNTSNLVSRAYKILSKQDSVLLRRKHQEWNRRLGKETLYEDYVGEFRHIYVHSNVPKYRSFQYILMQKGIVTNELLNKWQIIESPKCLVCGEDNETIVHLFVMCP